MKREPINHQEFHESALSEGVEPKEVGYNG